VNEAQSDQTGNSRGTRAREQESERARERESMQKKREKRGTPGAFEVFPEKSCEKYVNIL